jgi:DNA repair protein RAD16
LRRPGRPRSSLPAQLPPATSIVVQRARNLRNSEFSLNPVHKRKRSIWDEEDEEDNDSDNSPDAQMARALQDEENTKVNMFGNDAKVFMPRRTRRALRLIRPKADYAADFSDDDLDIKLSSLKKNADIIGKSNKTTLPGPKKAKFIIPDSDESEFVASEKDDASSGIGSRSSSEVPIALASVSREVETKPCRSRIQVIIDKSTNSKDSTPIRARGRLSGMPRQSLRRPGFNSASTLNEGSKQSTSATPEIATTPVISIHDDDTNEGVEDEWSGPGSSGSEAEPSFRRGGFERRRFRYEATSERYYERKAEKRAKLDRARLEAHHPELLTMWKDLEDLPEIKTTRAEQPRNISRQLKPFQLEGLSWMKAMEKTEWGGGLLGDEMGMGKTIQAVSLIMSDYPAKNPSLVLIPPVALMQWQQEIGDYTDGTLKSFVFHGTNKNTKDISVRELRKYDVILMSYNSLESMYRHQEKGFRRKEEVHFQKSVIHSLHFHRVILDEAHNIKVRYDKFPQLKLS